MAYRGRFLPFRLKGRYLVLLVGGAFLAVGPILAIMGIARAIEEARFRSDGQTVAGEVVTKTIQRADGQENSRTVYGITYRFTTSAGRVVEGTGPVGVEEWERLNPGNAVEVAYLPSAPEASNRLAGAGGVDDVIALLVLSAIATPVGGGLFLWQLRRLLRARRLRRHGSLAEAEVVEVRPSSITVNRVRQWRIHYRYRDHLGRSHDGRSEAMAPGDAKAWRPGEAGAVRFDPARPGESLWIGGAPVQGLTPPRAAPAPGRNAPRAAARWGGVLSLVLLATALGNEYQPLKDIERAIQQNETGWVIATGGLLAVGFALLMGGVLDTIMARSQPTDHGEVEQLYRSNRDLSAQPYAARASTYRVFGRAIGAQAHDEFSIRELKDTWRAGVLWADPTWRRRTVALLGGLMMVLGGFGLVFVLAPAPIKLLAVGAVLYTGVRAGRAFARA